MAKMVINKGKLMQFFYQIFQKMNVFQRKMKKI